MTKVVSIRLKDEQVAALARKARRIGRSPSETAAILLGEALVQQDFAFVEFRDSPIGRQAYLHGTRLAVWQIAFVARGLGGSIARTAEYFDSPQVQIAAALNYAKAFQKEMEAAISDSEWSAANIEQLIPNVSVVQVDEISA